MSIKLLDDMGKPVRPARPGEIRDALISNQVPKPRELAVLPKSPTRAMLWAGAELFHGDLDMALKCYNRMVAAAPSVPMRKELEL